MSLQFVPGISCLPDPGVERVVHRVELVPHLVGACTQSAVNFSPQAFRGGPFFLGPCDVLLGIPHPWIGDSNSVNHIEVDDWYCIVKANGSTLLRHFLEFYFWVSLLPCIFISFLMDLGNNKVFGKPKTDKVTMFGWPKLYNAAIFGEPKLDKTSKIN